jgi:hypothetical protein
MVQLRSNEGRGERSGRHPLKKSPVVRLQKTALPSLQKSKKTLDNLNNRWYNKEKKGDKKYEVLD